KHGQWEQGGAIDITIATQERAWSIRCRDDGGASAEDAARAAEARGLGTRVISSLASSLDAQIDWRAQDDGMVLEVAALSPAA
ncbi:MAG: histidine kinase, partial [Pseudomonadota bacterium]|nr:histidine kinase [Pseudomonadota bacterium]